MVNESVVERVRDFPGVRALGQPNSFTRQFDFWDDRFEARRLFSELLGTFLLVLVAVGGGMVNARFGGNAVPYSARVVAPGVDGGGRSSSLWGRSVAPISTRR